MNAPGASRVQVEDVLEVEMSDDEALALALAYCPDGESITIHDRACSIETGECSCVPRTLHKGAKA